MRTNDNRLHQSRLEIVRKIPGHLLIFSQNNEEQAVPFLAPALPTHCPSLVGRQGLLEALKQKLRCGTSALALNGLPGIGKTALALSLAHDEQVLARFPDGVLWASLGREADLFALLGKWATALGFTAGEIAQRRTVAQRRALLKAAIGRRKMLLIIDDAWHPQAALTLKLGGINCAHLVTTRQPMIALEFAGEEVTKVAELSPHDALRLLNVFAPMVMAADAKGAQEVVNAVGGLPLAIMLMGRYLQKEAYQGHPLQVRRALRGLRDAEERLLLEQPQSPCEHYPCLPDKTPLSLLAVIEMSDNVLDSVSRRTLYALSVLPAKPNSFSVDAALAVAKSSFRALNTLTDYGLLESSANGRYTLHQVIADYAKTQLTDNQSERRMVSYFVEYVAKNQKRWPLLEPETLNIVTTLETALKHEMSEPFVEGINAFYPFLNLKGFYPLAERLLRQAEEIVRAREDDQSLITTALHLGQAVAKQGNYNEAIEYLREGVALAGFLGERAKLPLLLNHLGAVCRERGKYQQAERYLQQGLKMARELNLCQEMIPLLTNLGILLEKTSAYRQAKAYFNEALSLARALANQEQASRLLLHLGIVANTLGNYEQAETFYAEGLVLAQSIGHRERISLFYLNMGVMALNRSALQDAQKALQESLTLAQKMGYRDIMSLLFDHLGDLAAKQGHYKQAWGYYQDGLKLARESGHQERISRLLLSLGNLTRDHGIYQQAEKHYLEGLVIADTLGHGWLKSGILAEWGDLHLKQKHWQEAEETYQEGLRIAQEAMIKQHIAKILYGLAQIALARQQYRQAQQLGYQSYTIFNGIGYHEAQTVKKWLTSLPKEQARTPVPTRRNKLARLMLAEA